MYGFMKFTQYKSLNVTKYETYHAKKTAVVYSFSMHDLRMIHMSRNVSARKI